MNKRPLPMPENATLSIAEQHVLDEACAAFERATGRFNARPVRVPAAFRAHADAMIRFGIGGQTFEMPAAVSVGVESVQDARAALLRRGAAPLPGEQQLMLVAPYVSAELAARLTDQGIPFLDTAGNASLILPEATVLISGRPKPSRTPRRQASRATTPKGLAVMFALATQPGLVAQPYRAIAAASGVALGTVNLAMDDLLARGLVAQRRNGERLMPDWPRFVQEWVALYPSRLRAKLPARRFAAVTPDWWRGFDFAAFDARLGGEPAADLLTHDLKPAAVTVYTHGAVPNRLLLQARLRPDERGDVELLEAFWPPSPALDWREQDVPLVPPLLIYADLVSSGDSRNLAAAEHIHDRYLAHPPA
ncbi:type IV toxin-antitoxin system AbiEi family antitoxin [Burkholderia ambifaria]|nr:type IV toxin-antitoxin system AbiEi family antitoxin [Burkholderia ambifaria]UZU06656.1 type IV toxin-antitoxin system AbiEi family antitoxin [Burkholderia ambifaria]UZU13210.1 type IV toxin-antitoxin system AbiEi family antitoxin [Burkholderia ambifaria]WDS17091.1 type IV toxin-antitoxin system AbiEi family antitoxin [Burkholderia ambifaria]WDS30237.1 type IV toxin-antitoxin system AbiEi family antitoxin [Burkholderia ambifaria]